MYQWHHRNILLLKRRTCTGKILFGGKACSCKYSARSCHHFAFDSVGILKFIRVSVETSGIHSFACAIPAMCISNVAIF